jgi:hypothetical protein
MRTDIHKILCFEGYARSSGSCLSSQRDSHEAVFTTTRELTPGEGLTVVIGFKPGIIPIVTIAPPKTVVEDIDTLPSILAFLCGLAVGTGTIFLLWWKRGRDNWSETSSLLENHENTTIKPLGAHETILLFCLQQADRHCDNRRSERRAGYFANNSIPRKSLPCWTT